MSLDALAVAAVACWHVAVVVTATGLGAGHRRTKEQTLGARTLGTVQANAAWLALASLAFNLLRAAGAAASRRHTKTRWATLRTHLVAVPARIASTAGASCCICLIGHWLLDVARLHRRRGQRGHPHTVQPAPVHRCWWWTGAVTTKGHGRFWVGTDPARAGEGFVVIAHRFGYALEFGFDALAAAPAWDTMSAITRCARSRHT